MVIDYVSFGVIELEFVFDSVYYCLIWFVKSERLLISSVNEGNGDRFCVEEEVVEYG